MALFLDRINAGQRLAELLKKYSDSPNTLVLALPRGGVPVAFEIAKKLHLPLDVYLVRKLGVPGHEELAMGAIAIGDIVVFNEDIVRDLSIPKDLINKVIEAERQELKRRNALYRQGRPPIDIHNKQIILVDDGVATGATMRAAIAAIKKSNPARLIIAVPLTPPDTYQLLKSEVDEIYCLATPEPFFAIGAHYENFSQTTDEEVKTLLAQAEELITKKGD